MLDVSTSAIGVPEIGAASCTVLPGGVSATGAASAGGGSVVVAALDSSDAVPLPVPELPAAPVSAVPAAGKFVPRDGSGSAGVAVEAGRPPTSDSDGPVSRVGSASPIEAGLPDAVADAAI